MRKDAVPVCRERLFELINDLPTCYEIVAGKASVNKQQNKKRAPAPMTRPTQPKHPRPVS